MHKNNVEVRNKYMGQTGALLWAGKKEREFGVRWGFPCLVMRVSVISMFTTFLLLWHMTTDT